MSEIANTGEELIGITIPLNVWEAAAQEAQFEVCALAKQSRYWCDRVEFLIHKSSLDRIQAWLSVLSRIPYTR